MQCNNKEPKLSKSICEVEIDGKMALVSLYDDLPHFEYDMTIDNLKDSNTKLKTIIQELKKRNEKLEKELSQIKSVNLVLSKNITSLYKTATSEIQRKDRIIGELRKRHTFEESRSRNKMFSSNNSPLQEKSEFNKSSAGNKDANQIKCTVDTSKELNQNYNEDITNVVIQPNRDIPKTVYYKRLCQKLVSQNKMIESKNIIPKYIENNDLNIVNKVTLNGNEEHKNNRNVSKEITTRLIQSDPEDNKKKRKKEENVSLSSLSPKPKNPVKLKKKMVIAPATIGVQNIPNKTLENVEKLNRSVYSDISCQISNSPQNKITETCNSPFKLEKSPSILCKQLPTDNASNKLIECIKSFTKSSEIQGVKSPTNNENKSSSSSKQNNDSLEYKLSVIKSVDNLTEPNCDIECCLTNKSDETSFANKTSINIEVEQIPIRKRTVTILKDNNIPALTKARESSRITCISPSNYKELNMATKNVKNLTMNNENELILPEKKINQSELKIPALNNSSNLELTHVNSLTNDLNKSDGTSITENTSINIEVEQGSIFRRSNLRKVIMHSNFDHRKLETKKGRRVQLITIKDHCSQPSPSFNGAKKREIDVSKNSIHIEKVVESSSLFYIPKIKRRRTLHFGNAEY